MKKIFADFNNTDSQGRVRLNTLGTIEDIEKQEIYMMIDLEVLLDDYDELSISGIIEFSEKENIWVAVIKRDELQ
ncbi:MAG: hypothetical protein WBC06_08405 [Chitinophagaceae bacterium]